MIYDHVSFSSAYFVVEPGEDTETNPGIYGRALASWVADKLQAHGISVDGGIVAEDFGRCMMVRRRPFMLWVACSNADGSSTRWQMFIALENSITNRLFHRADPTPELQRLREQYRALVQEVPEVSDVVWEK
jgi:hypothetical protein